MIFEKRQDYVADSTGNALGAVVTQELTRENPIESIIVRLNFTSTGAIHTATADGLLGLLKRVRLTVSDGARTRIPVDISGRALIERAQQATGFLTRGTIAATGATAATAYEIVYPIHFALPNLSDPVRSCLLLPAPRYNQNPVLELTLASVADVDAGTPTFAISGGVSVSITVNRRVVSRLNWPFYDTELAESVVFYAATGRHRYELQIPGAYTSLDLRMYSTAAARANVITAGGGISLELLNVLVRRFRTQDIIAENDLSVDSATAFAGLATLDFLADSLGDASELGSVLDVNVGAGSGSRAALIQDITGGAAVKISYVSHRIFGDLAALKAPVSK
jgi:hypothetical protein